MWRTPDIPALGRYRQENQEFKISLSYAIPCLNVKKNKLEPLGLGGLQESIPVKFSLSDSSSLSVQKIISSRTPETKHG